MKEMMNALASKATNGELMEFKKLENQGPADALNVYRVEDDGDTFMVSVVKDKEGAVIEIMSHKMSQEDMDRMAQMPQDPSMMAPQM